MCIIAAKSLGTDWPTIDIVNNCCENNPDGFSIAWNENGELKTFRSMDKAEFLARYHTISHTVDPNTSAAIIHARWATHGSKKLENCHCWIGGGLAFAHNGVLTNIPNQDDMTDSETFFRDYFLPVYETLGWERAKLIASAIVGTSRFAWLDVAGNIYMMGKWEKCQDQGRKGKLYFSNSGYLYCNNKKLNSNSLFSMSQGVRSCQAYGTMSAKRTNTEKFNDYGALYINRTGK